MYKEITLAGCLLLALCTLWGQTNIDNPVLPEVADAGVMKYNGRYYIGGVFTNGDFYVSKDLTHWEGPFHAVTMNNDWATPFNIVNEQIHANDLHYLNGVFHLYWSVNYWGKERNVVHIAHAVADSPLGPYHEPDKSQWLDNRIDAHLFTDDDGKHYFYMVKFTDGNAIWVRPMKNPSTFDGEAQHIFASQPDSWETLDNRVAEGPWVIKYRNRYYMMYNANHTSTRWGNYALGVAEASSPLGFNHGNKYPHPVVKSNQIDLEENFVDLLANQRSDTSGLHKSFVLDRAKNGNLSLRIRHWGAAKVRLNGTLVYESDRTSYRHVDLRPFKNSLKDGKNSLVVESDKSGKSWRSGFTSVALFDMKDQTADDILYTPGQPNILRGPNGFEWWLIYMANKNGEPRGQYINRVHFLGSKLTVDGITGKNTSGYHPLPSKPTYQYLSENSQTLPPVNQTIPSVPAMHYYFEAGVKTSGAADGVIAWQADENNLLKITLDAHAKKWHYLLVRNGAREAHEFPLPPDFRAGVYHTIAVFKNHSAFYVLIDNIPAPQKPVIETDFTSRGLPGICSDSQGAEFDGITYTVGWDEYGGNIRGWEESADVKGLHLKGDLLDSYELSMQLSAGAGGQKSSIYPIYVSKDNFLRVDIDYAERKISVSGKNKGKTVDSRSFDLSSWQDYYVNNVFSDAMERHFTLDSSVLFDAVLLPQKSVFRSDTLIEDIDAKYDIFCVQDGKPQAVSHPKKTDGEHTAFTRVDFAPVKSNGLVFIKKTSDNVLLQKIRIRELVKQNYSLRIAKDSTNVRIFVDNKPVCEVTEQFGASRAGLLTGNADYITLFHTNR
jgi:GH43 family beta-xylosidase